MKAILAILAAVGLSASAAFGRAGDKWWLEAWGHRHVVEVVSPDPSGAINTALASIDTAGLAQEDGRDIRVVEADSGAAMPHRLESLRGGVAGVRFQVKAPDALFYHVYYGNPEAEGAEREWDERVGGLRLRIYKNEMQQAARNLNHMRELLAAAKTMTGEGHRRMIDDVSNPFDEPADHYLSVYEGKIFCREDGTYAFATNSDDSSFLLINDELVAQMPGRNVPLLDFEMRAGRGGRVELTRGIHSITYYHVKVTGDQLARAGWRPPWARRLETIPEDAFIRELRVETLARQARDKALNAFFSYIQGEAVQFAGVERTFVTMHFSSRVSNRFGDPVLWDWDFGDGNVSSVENPRHMYKEEGVYTVRLLSMDRLGFWDECERQVRVKARSPARLRFHIETHTPNAVLRHGEPVRLAIKYRGAGPEPWRCTLSTSVLGDQGRVLSRTENRALVSPRRWNESEVVLRIKEPEARVRVALNFEGVPLAERIVHVVAPERVRGDLHESNGVFVNEKGELVVMRLSRQLDAPQRPSLPGKLREQGKALICVIDDSLAPAGGAESELSYYAVLRRELAKRYPKADIEVRRIGAGHVSHHDPLRRIGLAPRVAAEANPDLIVLAASMRDMTTHLPADQYELYLYAMVDRLRGATDAAVLLVTPPPLLLNPELSKAYAEATVRVGLMRGLDVVDVYSAFARLGEERWQEFFQDPSEPDVLYLYPGPEGQERIGMRLFRAIVR